VCNSIHTTCGTHAGWQSHCKVDIIYNSPWQYLGVASSCLLSILRLSKDGSHFVGMHICGNPVLMDIAFPRPIVLPPPMEMTESAFTDLAYSKALSVMCDGVCIVASEKAPASLPLSKVFNCVKCSTCCGVERRRGLESFCRETSSESLEIVPLPNITRAGAALYSKASILAVLHKNLCMSVVWVCFVVKLVLVLGDLL
jgi:hypothetical protein